MPTDDGPELPLFDPGDEDNVRSLWEKVGTFFVEAGKELIELILTMFYVAKDEETPPWVRALVVSAIAYFLMPVDAIPDALPGIGFTDDAGVVAAVVAAIAAHIADKHREQAKAQMDDWADN